MGGLAVKMKTMRNRISVLAATVLSLAGCYDGYIIDYDVKGVCFANQVDVRSVIVGEGMRFSTAVVMGGMRENDEDRMVTLSTDLTLLGEETLSAMKSNTLPYMQEQTASVSALKVLPASNYSMDLGSGIPGVALIRKGDHKGRIEIQIDSAAFLSGEDKLLPVYALPLRITDPGTLSLIEGKETTVIGVHYESMLFGNWWHGGVCRDDAGEVVSSYPLSVPQEDTKVWTLATCAPFSLTANAVAGELNGSQAQMKLTLNSDNTVSVESVPGAKFSVEPDGKSVFNGAPRIQDREIYLKYKFVRDGKTIHATDTLSFRNRIRDGVNEWQDERTNLYD